MSEPRPLAGADDAEAFYRDVMLALQRGGVPFLVGGAWGYAHFTGIRRTTKDLDLFVRPSDWDRLAEVAAAAGHRVELTFSHWLGKILGTAGFVDVVFGSGNGLSPVDDAWFEHAVEASVLDVPVKLVPAEESLWTKAFIMERERYDGADVAHLLQACAARMDWPRLLQRFGPHWRVLLSHLVLFGFVYPGERDRVPRWVVEDLVGRLLAETRSPAPHTDRCAGTLLSRAQYLPDITESGHGDARVDDGRLTPEQVAAWTAAIATPEPPP